MISTLVTLENDSLTSASAATGASLHAVACSHGPPVRHSRRECTEASRAQGVHLDYSPHQRVEHTYASCRYISHSEGSGQGPLHGPVH